jgi:hypothetical protein
MGDCRTQTHDARTAYSHVASEEVVTTWHVASMVCERQHFGRRCRRRGSHCCRSWCGSWCGGRRGSCLTHKGMPTVTRVPVRRSFEEDSHVGVIRHRSWREHFERELEQAHFAGIYLQGLRSKIPCIRGAHWPTSSPERPSSLESNTVCEQT